VGAFVALWVSFISALFVKVVGETNLSRAYDLSLMGSPGFLLFLISPSGL
jgi:hypothetical protein